MENKIAANLSREKDIFIVCRNSQGTPVRGSLMHFSNQNAIFEVYNPFSILQLSEVLSDFKIMFGDRVLYAGRSVVSSLVNTGIMLVCEVTLVDSWSDVDIFSILNDKTAVRDEVQRFISDWRVKNEVVPEFKVLTSDFQGFLADLSLWLKHIEVTMATAAPHADETFYIELVEKVVGPLKPVAEDFLGRLETLASNVVPEQVGIHKSYIRRDVHPLTLCAPFVHRSFTKPLGYAGDYEMISMILERPYEGRTLFARAVNKLITDSAPAEAHRNRIVILRRLLEQEAERAGLAHRPLEVLNVGCGPAKEVREFIAESPNSNLCRMTLMDFSKEALDFARKKVMEQKASTGSAMTLEFVEKSIDELLRESLNPQKTQQVGAKKYHLVYCAGLFDYLTDSVCRRLIALFYEWLLPGGVLCVTNIHPSNPQRYLMEYLLEWNVIHRTEAEFERLGTPEGKREVFPDKTGVNIFLTIRKTP